MLRSIYRWSRRNGLQCALTGIDLNPRSEAVAKALHPARAPIAYRTGDYADLAQRSEAHTSELQSLMRISYAVFCLKKKNNTNVLEILLQLLIILTTDLTITKSV